MWRDRTRWLAKHRRRAVRPFFDPAFAKRPAEELYDLDRDPDQVHNLADDPAYASARAELAARLTAELKRTADPRADGQKAPFDDDPFCMGNYNKRVEQYLKEHPDEKKP